MENEQNATMAVEGSSHEQDRSEDSLKEPVKKIESGEINEAENTCEIPVRVIHHQNVKEDAKTQLKPEKPVNAEVKNNEPSMSTKSVQMDNADLNGVVNMLSSETEEVKSILTNECSLIYECKVCLALFRSIVNLITHKRLHCGSYGGKNNTKDAKSCKKVELKSNQHAKNRSNTCKTDLVSVLRRTEIPAMSCEIELPPMDINEAASYQSLIPNISFRPQPISKTAASNFVVKTPITINGDNSPISEQTSSAIASASTAESKTLYGCPCCGKGYILKKSIDRHLRDSHHKTRKQIEALKSKIKEIPHTDNADV